MEFRTVAVKFGQSGHTTLLMTGARDGTVPPKVSRDIAVKLPAAQSLTCLILGIWLMKKPLN